MSNILSTWSKAEVEKLLKEKGYRLIATKAKESIIIKIEGKEHLGSLEAPYVAAKEKNKYVVMVKELADEEATAPEFRSKLIEYDRVFGLKGILLVDPKEKKVSEISFRYPRERGLDFYFQFIAALFILGIVIGIIWLMTSVKLF